MYNPKLKPENVHQLYLLKVKLGKPMTVLVNLAIEDYLEKNKNVLEVPKND